MKDNLAASMKNIEKATKAFNQNMEAIKHSFLFRGYFRRLEKQKTQDSTYVYEWQSRWWPSEDGVSAVIVLQLLSI